MPRYRLAWLALCLCQSLACNNDGKPCFAGDYTACTCTDGASGYAMCASDGSAYGTCDCSGTALGPPPATTACVDNVTVPGKLCLLSGCERNEQCDSGLCFAFNAKGSKCTRTCTTNLDCPAPSPGCNNMGVCKAP